MKTYYYGFRSGYIGGFGVVVAKNIDDALEIANCAIENEPMAVRPQTLTKEDLKPVNGNESVIIFNGDY